jgi:hypothetical protein
MSATAEPAQTKATAATRRRLFRRGPWEGGAIALIGAGVVMLTQPISLTLYSYSFVTILAGTLGFVIVSHFPE